MDSTLSLPPNTEQTRLSDAVYETLLKAILSGRLEAGGVVSEVSLAKQLDVSRTPVHDAMRQLAKDGLVEQRANRRAVIATFSRDDVYDIFEMRKILETEAARRAASRVDRSTMAKLRESVDTLCKSTSKPDWINRWADQDEEFHNAIGKAAGSLRLWQDIVRYRMLHRGFNTLTTNVEVLQQALQEHYRILESLEARDGEKAARSMMEHIQEWQAYFVNQFPR